MGMRGGQAEDAFSPFTAEPTPIRFTGSIYPDEPFSLRAHSDPHRWGGSWYAEVKRVDKTKHERPDSFVLRWSETRDLRAELYAIVLSKVPVLERPAVTWRFPVSRVVEKPSGAVDFRGVIPSTVWKSALAPATFEAYLRKLPVEGPLRNSASSENVERYSGNDVALVFPSVAKVLWSDSARLVAASEYFATLLVGGGFAETEDKIAPPFLEAELLGVSTESGANAKALEKTDKADVAKQSLAPEDAQHEGEEGSDSDADAEGSATPLSSAPAITRIVLRDASYKTYRAVLTYLATGKITFAHLSSLYPDSPSDSSKATRSHFPLESSPKSIYKLADYLSLRDLKGLAFTNFESQLCANNALTELLSDLSSDYDEIRQICIAAVLRHWPAVVETGEITELGRQMVAGELEAGKAEVVWEVMSRLVPPTA